MNKLNVTSLTCKTGSITSEKNNISSIKEGDTITLRYDGQMGSHNLLLGVMNISDTCEYWTTFEGKVFELKPQESTYSNYWKIAINTKAINKKIVANIYSKEEGDECWVTEFALIIDEN